MQDRDAILARHKSSRHLLAFKAVQYINQMMDRAGHDYVKARDEALLTAKRRLPSSWMNDETLISLPKPRGGKKGLNDCANRTFRLQNDSVNILTARDPKLSGSLLYQSSSTA
jgi:hypothetical protein